MYVTPGFDLETIKGVCGFEEMKVQGENEIPDVMWQVFFSKKSIDQWYEFASHLGSKIIFRLFWLQML